MFGVSHASGIGRLHAFYEVHRAARSRDIDAACSRRRLGRGKGKGGGGGRTGERESLAITALLLRSMVANLYDKQPVLGVHARSRVYTYTYVADVPVNKHPGTNNARHSGPSRVIGTATSEIIFPRKLMYSGVSAISG